VVPLLTAVIAMYVLRYRHNFCKYTDLNDHLKDDLQYKVYASMIITKHITNDNKVYEQYCVPVQQLVEW